MPATETPSPDRSTEAHEEAGPGKRRIRGLIKIGVSLSLLAFLISRVDISAVGTTLRNIRIDLLIVTLVMSHLDRFLQAGKWWVLVRSSGVRFSLMQAVANTYAGNFAGQFLPAGVGGDVVRVLLLHRMKLPAIEVAASIVVERLFGLFALVTVASIAIGAGLQPGFDLPGDTEIIIVALLVAMSAGIALSFTSRAERAFGAWIRSMNSLPIRMRFLSKVHDLFLAYRRYASRRFTLVLYFLLSILEVLLVIGLNWVMCRALHIDIGLQPLMLIVPVSLILQRIPISVNGLGVQEGVLGYFFMTAGYGLDTGLALSFAFRILELGILIPGGFFLWRHRSAARSASAIPLRLS